MRRIRNVDIAAAVGCSPAYIGQVLNGAVAPSERVRRGIAEFLGEAEDELFRSDVADEFAAVAEFVARTSRASNVPLKVEDADAADRVASLLRATP
jgi:transcriptional regulator with XRE-family HTH domain